MYWSGLATVLLLFAAALAPEIPAGTVIPIMLRSALNAKKDKGGEKIEGRVMQDVRLSEDRKIEKGSRITGRIVSIAKPGSSGASVVVKFETIEDHGHTFQVTAAALAVASMASVAQAQAPINVATSDVDPATQWVTRQVGGDVVNRGRGKVASPGGVFGTWVEGSSVLIKLTSDAAAGCPSGAGYDREQAVWIFSSSACGTYDLGETKIASSGATPPVGEIVLKSGRNVAVRGGSGWLLMVVAGTVGDDHAKF